jgi:hypothetical protein
VWYVWENSGTGKHNNAVVVSGLEKMPANDLRTNSTPRGGDKKRAKTHFTFHFCKLGE